MLQDLTGSWISRTSYIWNLYIRLSKSFPDYLCIGHVGVLRTNLFERSWKIVKLIGTYSVTGLQTITGTGKPIPIVQTNTDGFWHTPMIIDMYTCSVCGRRSKHRNQLPSGLTLSSQLLWWLPLGRMAHTQNWGHPNSPDSATCFVLGQTTLPAVSLFHTTPLTFSSLVVPYFSQICFVTFQRHGWCFGRSVWLNNFHNETVRAQMILIILVATSGFMCTYMCMFVWECVCVCACDSLKYTDPQTYCFGGFSRSSI